MRFVHPARVERMAKENRRSSPIDSSDCEIFVPCFIPAVQNVAAKFEEGGLFQRLCLSERLQFQPARIHEVVVVVVSDVPPVAIENAGVVGQQICLVRPDDRERFSPQFHTDLPIWGDCAGWQRAFNREQSGIRRQLLEAKWRFILADFDLGRRELMPVDPNVCCGKRSPVA